MFHTVLSVMSIKLIEKYKVKKWKKNEDVWVISKIVGRITKCKTIEIRP
jgi:hypothetical protein